MFDWEPGRVDCRPATSSRPIYYPSSVTDAQDPEFVDLRQKIEDLRAGSRYVDVVVDVVPKTLRQLDELASVALSRAAGLGSFEVDYSFST